jgi:hypothetical protein
MSYDRRDEAPTVVKVVAGLAVLASAVFGGAWIFGNREPHNHRISGTVVSEKELYGNVLLGYATERKGVKGFVEKKLHGALRPGPAMHLYSLVPQQIEYDTVRWFKPEHHVEKLVSDADVGEVLKSKYKDLVGLAGGIHLQTEGDIADEGDRFSTSADQLGRLSKTFLVRGVRYTLKREDGKEEVFVLHNVLKQPGDIKFEKPGK